MLYTCSKSTFINLSITFMDCSSFRFQLATQNPAELNTRGNLMAAMATCHSLTMIGGELNGDPLDLIMFNATNWVSLDMVLFYFPIGQRKCLYNCLFTQKEKQQSK